MTFAGRVRSVASSTEPGVIRNPHNHEHMSYPIAPIVTATLTSSPVISAKAGIHCTRISTPRTRSGLLDYL